MIDTWLVRYSDDEAKEIADLTRPEGDDGAEGVAGLSTGSAHLLESSTEGSGEGTVGGGLNLDLGHFEGAESNVGDEFSGSRTGEPDQSLVLLTGFLASEVHVGILEDFVETVLEHSLKGVADESGSKTFPDTIGTLFFEKELDTGTETVVF